MATNPEKVPWTLFHKVKPKISDKITFFGVVDDSCVSNSIIYTPNFFEIRMLTLSFCYPISAQDAMLRLWIADRLYFEQPLYRGIKRGKLFIFQVDPSGTGICLTIPNSTYFYVELIFKKPRHISSYIVCCLDGILHRRML